MKGRRLPQWTNLAPCYIAEATSSLAEMGSILVEWTSSAEITDGANDASVRAWSGELVSNERESCEQ